MNTATLLISCPDQKGITASITNFIYNNNGNIEHADQHIDAQSNTFFMRIEWALGDFAIAKGDIANNFLPLAKKFNMNWSLYFSEEIPQIAIFVSKFTHCLYDLLMRYREGEFKCQPPIIISNHLAAEKIAKDFNIKFFHFLITKDNKIEQEKTVLREE